ncbi:hypothetical protein O6H91_Y040100 [Diphasiastrum complanatum]|nr:hypothetical protein O6H91_Y040100 [Diphasiastrum complanatum]
MGCFGFVQAEKREQGDKREQAEKRDSKGKERRLSWWFSISGASSPDQKSVSEKNSSVDSEASKDSPNSTVVLTKQNELRMFSLSELKVATKNFYPGNLLGQGGFGCVYKGYIKQKKGEEGEWKLEVAVKQLDVKGVQGHKEWISEIKYLGSANHPNLVTLVGYCAEDDERGVQMLLVYEFMPNKSLEAHLFGQTLPVLSWLSRVKIALGAAQGLAYLHEEIKPQIIFRDFKTSNILLDGALNAKLSDFGLARQGPDIGDSHVSTAVVGTPGYAAPEYVNTGHLTCMSDVWSFGVVLLELLTGRKAVDKNRPKNERRLLEWVKPYVADHKKFHLMMDPRLERQYSLKAAQKIVYLASRCLMRQPKSRPKMSDIVQGLIEVVAMSNLPSPVHTPVHQIGEQTLKVLQAGEMTPKDKYPSIKQELNQKVMLYGDSIWHKLTKSKVVRT